MSSTILYKTFDNWLGRHRKQFGSDWLSEESWGASQWINQFIRFAGYMYDSTADFEDWLDNEFDSVISDTMKLQKKNASVVGLEM